MQKISMRSCFNYRVVILMVMVICNTNSIIVYHCTVKFIIVIVALFISLIKSIFL